MPHLTGKNDWYQNAPYRKSRKGKKPFVIECRYTGKCPWRTGWIVWGRYKTEKARDTALATLKRKRIWNGIDLRPYEYRAAPTD